MEDIKTQHETPGLSIKSKETNNINDSQENPNKDTNPLNITSDLLPPVRQNIYINPQLITILPYFYKYSHQTKENPSKNQIEF